MTARHATRRWPLRLALGVVLAGLVATALELSPRSVPRVGVAATPTAAPPSPPVAVPTSAASTRSAPTGAGSTRSTPTGAASTRVPPKGVTSTAPSTAPASSTASSLPTTVSRCGLALPAARARPVGHCTVLEIGDSLGNDLGWGLRRHVAASSGLRLVQADVSASGLAHPSFYDWPVHLATDLHRYHPQLVLVCVGGDDEQGMVVDGSAVQFPTPTWRRAYRGRVRTLLREARGAGALVLWVGMPVMQQPGFSAGMETINGIDREAVGATPGAAFLSVWQLFADPAGAFQADAAVNGTVAALREPDGVHYAEAGEDVIATFVVRRIASLFGVRLSPTDPAVITGWG